MKTNTIADIPILAKLAILFTLAALVFVSFSHFLPDLWSATSDEVSGFSLARAKADVETISEKPHPIGTRENDAVREYIIQRIGALGLKAYTQSGVAISKRYRAVGAVHNVFTRLPGRIPGKAVLLVAHYDSAPTSFGAADDGASVAAMLETLRVLRSSAALRNDVLCLFTDGEEAGLLGAELFAENQLLMKEIGLVLNFDFRGTGGPLWMYETSNGNGELVKGFARAASMPLGSSLMYEVYKRMPNDTDLSVFKKAGLPAMNFAAIGNFINYHTSLDRAGALDKRSLRLEGNLMLELVRHYGNLDLGKLSGSDKVYFNIPGGILVNYPVGLTMPLTCLVLGLFAAVIFLGRRNRALKISKVFFASLLFMVTLAGIAALAQVAWMLILYFCPDYKRLLQGAPYGDLWFLAAFLLFVFSVFVVIQIAALRRINAWESVLGVHFFLILLLVAIAVAAPGASFVLIFPLMGMLFALLFVQTNGAAGRQGEIHAAALAIGLAPAILILAPLVYLIHVALTFRLIAATVSVFVILLGLSLPLMQTFLSYRKLPALTLVTSMLLLVLALGISRFTPTQPMPDNLFYVMDSMESKAYWLSTDRRLDAWTRTIFPNNASRRIFPAVAGNDHRLLWVGAAPILNIPGPSIEILSRSGSESAPVYRLRIRSVRGASRLDIRALDAVILESSVSGKTLTSTPDKNWTATTHGFRDENLLLTLRKNSTKPSRITVTDVSYGLSPLGVPARPGNIIPQPFRPSDTIQVSSSLELK